VFEERLGGREVFDHVEREDVVELGGVDGQDWIVQVVPVERLIDLIWDESPPQTAGALVHTYRRATARSSFVILGEAFDAVMTTAPRAADESDGSAATRHDRGAVRWGARCVHTYIIGSSSAGTEMRGMAQSVRRWPRSYFFADAPTAFR